jgi:excinuclease UvrABC nuclease subunit
VKASVYLAYGGKDKLLYVGITGVRTKRFSQHRLSSEWWDLAERIELEHYPTRSQALAREANLIFERQPPFNRIGLAAPPRPPIACLWDVRAAAAHVEREKLPVAYWAESRDPQFNPEDLDWWMREEMESAGP